ncbi:probable RNA-binding protein CG14230 [Chelonus insularis]|uniref:probable RNA-binding protein CG14230 n=1 Tax=Chelonus insularis TaxID=460826 RepID=UPI00158944FF|nr:probable RNA-binding protein CG14230 [Chelonus insularis]
MEKNYRLFVKCLPNNITSDKLQKLFDKYGSISKVDIKEKSMNDGSKIAFINITSTDRKLNNCYQDINSTVLEGKNLSVELAKESFLEKLKREREEAQKKTTEKPNGKILQGPLEPINIKIPDKLKNRQKSLISQTTEFSQDQNLPEYTVKCSSQIKEINANSDIINNSDKNKYESELKRVASLKQRKQSFKAKEQLIRNALKTVDSKKNKIVFSDDVENSVNNLSHQKKPSNHPQLFDDDNDDDNEHNEITFDFNKKYKPQAQSIGNDSRFIMDDRFNEDEEEDCQNENDESNTENLEKDELTKEKEQELKILENVLGKPMIQRDDKNIPPRRTNAMIRYDPTKDDHRKHEIKFEEKISEPKKKKKKKAIIEETEQPIPVSNEVFYSVSDNLKESLTKKEEGFSLLKTFGATDIPENKNNNDSAEAILHQSSKLGANFDIKNPFRYDSSESEDEDFSENTNTRNDSKENGLSNNSSSYYIDKFFLIDDDPRFKDAEDFFGTCSTSETPFNELRRELKNIVRSKVRNNVRKTLPWKKKISSVKRVTKRRK